MMCFLLQLGLNQSIIKSLIVSAVSGISTYIYLANVNGLNYKFWVDD
ncbi:hypothetical protein [Paenibacillus turpanensis]|nr:hypothetical protein [Paenibacillus turpanensis]